MQNKGIPYAQDELDSEIEDLVLPDKKGEEVVVIRFPYSIYAYSGLLLFVGLAGFLPYRLWRKRKKYS